jgi:hypothetical protein
MKPLLIIAASIAAASCAPMGRTEARQAALAEARPVGEPVDCVNLSQIRNTRVRSARVIDFEMTGGTVYRNTLPNECPGLSFEERFSYATSLSRLCSVDIITVLHTGGGAQRGASCGLGSFQRVELPRR